MSTIRDPSGVIPVLEPRRLLGRVVGGKVEIRDLLGEGSMGFVFRGVHLSLGKTVAIKVLKPNASWDPTWRARFEREARSAARFDHPNSVQILDYGEEAPDGLTYIVMELIEGRSLSEELAAFGPMSPERIARIMRQVLAALAAAHQRSVIHRDIKSANIMIFHRTNDDGELVEHVKVCDFGIAKMLAPDGRLDGDAAPLTHTGAFVGTPAYMSPEQASADPIDERTDIYSCGVVMYEMLSGQLPYEAENHMAMIAKHLAEDPPHLSDLVPGIDRRIETIVHWALERRRELRCPSARELRRALKEFLLAMNPDEDSARMEAPALTTSMDHEPIPELGNIELGDEDETMPMAATLVTRGDTTKPGSK